ncbi:alpha/beta fold hydrolase [Streptomyces erythrochromogenes]|uniref:alpha/beta fold hydrolase n=1 Tax=Streptomyces erythrochromogenes TaxID=285574 RepID=UPI0036A559FA
MADHLTPTPDGSGPAHRTAGPDDGDPPLVLLTSPQDTAGDWAPVRDALAPGRRIYTPDLGGPTGCDRPAPLMRDDLLGFLDALGLGRVDLVGRSTGALAALLVAQAAPHRVVRLVLADLPPDLPREPPSAPGRITAPTLVVNGAADPAGLVPDARTVSIPADGRPVHEAAPAAFTRAVEAFLDEVPDSELALRWLAGSAITRTGESSWWDADPPAGPLTADDVIDQMGWLVFDDEDLDLAGRVRVALGLMDLLGSHPLLAGQIHMAHLGPRGPLPLDVLWDGYRRRLEAVRDHAACPDSLWLDWFEDPRSAAPAFAAVLGDDRHLLLPGAPEPLVRRARRVLEYSGPVGWDVKAESCRAAARVPALHHAVFRAVLRSYHDLYGGLDPVQGLALLDGLDLPPDTERLAPLRRVLADGHRHHYASPQAWGAALDR